MCTLEDGLASEASDTIPETPELHPGPIIIAAVSSVLTADLRPHADYQRLLMLGRAFNLFVISHTVLPEELRAVVAQRITFKRRGWGRLLNVLWALVQSVQAVRKLQSEFPSRVIAISSDFRWPALLGYLAKRMLGVQWILHVWDHLAVDAKVMWGEHRPVRAVISVARAAVVRRIAKEADVVVTSIGIEVLRGWAGESGVIVRCPNGHLVIREQVLSDVRALGRAAILGIGPDTRGVDILYVGYVSRSRGCDTVVEGFRKASHLSSTHLRLHFVGPLDRRFTQHEDPRFQGRIILHGPKRHDDCLRIIAASDICVYPFPDTLELRYIYPIKVLEYMALGKPILASRTPGVAELIEDGRSCVMFEPGDSDSFAAALSGLASNEEARRRMGAEALSRSRAFEWAVIQPKVARDLARYLERDSKVAAAP